MCRSVLAQTYHNLEILLINDGATDSSPQICESYAKQDARIKLIHKEMGVIRYKKYGHQTV